MGAQQFCKSAFGDEAEDIETVFNQWRDSMLSAYQKLRISSPSMLSEANESLLRTDLSPAPGPPSSNTHYEYAVETYLQASNYYPEDLKLMNFKLLREDPMHPVYHIEVDCDGMAYAPAQDVALFPTNSDAQVTVLAGLQSYDLSHYLSFRSKLNDILPFPTPITVHDALARFCDINGKVGREIVERLSQYAQKEEEKEELKRIAGLGFSQFQKEVVQARVSVMTLLESFRSVKVPIGDFVQIVNRIQPRYFTISSSPKVHPHRFHLCVAVLKSTLPSGAVWTGHCTGYLEAVCTTSPLGQVRVLLAESRFKLPEKPAPVMMVGNGCGIAPFRAFAQELQYRAIRTF